VCGHEYSLNTCTTHVVELDLHLHLAPSQVSCLHLQRLEHRHANEILLTQRNKHTNVQTPGKYSQPLTWWSTLPDMTYMVVHTTRHFLHGGPHYQTCLTWWSTLPDMSREIVFDLFTYTGKQTDRHVENNTSFRCCISKIDKIKRCQNVSAGSVVM